MKHSLLFGVILFLVLFVLLDGENPSLALQDTACRIELFAEGNGDAPSFEAVLDSDYYYRVDAEGDTHLTTTETVFVEPYIIESPASAEPTSRYYIYVVGKTPDYIEERSWLIQYNTRLYESSLPEIALVPFDAFEETFETSFDALFDEDGDGIYSCNPPMWGQPLRRSLPLTELADASDGLNLSAYPQRGEGVKVGIIDTRYEELNDVFLNYGIEAQVFSLSSSELPAQLLPFEESQGAVFLLDDGDRDFDSSTDSQITERGHGTKLFHTVYTLAPRANYFLTRAETLAEFEEAVDRLIAADVRIIIHAGNVIVRDPAPYYEKVQLAADLGILWINSAGNIGAGYYYDVTTGETTRHQFAHTNRGLPSGTSFRIPVAVNEFPITATMLWEQSLEPTGEDDDGNPIFPLLADFDLSFYVISQAIGKSNTRQNYEDASLQFESLTIERGTNLYDAVGLPLPSGYYREVDNVSDIVDACGFNSPRQADCRRDNDIYLFIDSPASGFAEGSFVDGIPFELYISWVLPRDLDPELAINPDELSPYVNLAPVVLVPGDMEDVLTIGAFTPEYPHFTSIDDISAPYFSSEYEVMTWYSSRSNSYQYYQAFEDANGEYLGIYDLKPNVATYGDIRLPALQGQTSGEAFFGTSAATGVAGGVAVVIASNFPEADSTTLRLYMEHGAIRCLKDGAVGRQIGRLLLPDLATLSATSPNYSCPSYLASPSDYDDILIYDEDSDERDRLVERQILAESNPVVRIEQPLVAGVDGGAANIVTEPLTIRGSAWSQEATGYAIEIAVLDSDEWMLAPNFNGQTVVEAEETPYTDACAYAETQTVDFLPTPDVKDADLYLLEILPDGLYKLRLILCNDGEIVGGNREGDVQFLVANSASLSLTPPEGIFEEQISLSGTAFADPAIFAGYIVHFYQEGDVAELVYPSSLFGESLGETVDICRSDSADNIQPQIMEGLLNPVTEDVLFNIERGDYRNIYTVRVALCLKYPGDGLVTFAEATESISVAPDEEVNLDVTNFLVLENRVELFGTIAFYEEENFEQYIIEIAPASDDEEAELLWQVVIGPQGIPGDSFTVQRCAVSAPQLSQGRRPRENDTLGSFDISNLPGGTYIVRITACSSNGRAQSIVDTEPRITFSTGGTQNPVTVRADEPVTVHESPSADSPEIAVVEDGTTVLIVGTKTEGDWIQVTLPDGNTGWVVTESVLAVAIITEVTAVPTEALVIEATPVEATPSTANTDNTSGSTEPVISFSQVYYSSNKTGDWQIFSTNRNGSNERQLTTLGNNEFPSLSPSGQIVFSSDRDGNREIYLMNQDGSNQINLTNSAAEDYRPVWSPDGRSIIFESDRDGERNLYVLSINTLQLTQITFGNTLPCCIDWSSNGSQLVFAANVDGAYDIFIGEVNGTGTIRLTYFETDALYPVWQPNGEWIIFQADDEIGFSQIYAVRTNGTGLLKLTNGEYENIEPVWASSNQILFSSNRNGAFDVYTMSLDGSNQRLLFDNFGSEINTEPR